MKKLLSFIIVSLFVFITLFGCSSKKEISRESIRQDFLDTFRGTKWLAFNEDLVDYFTDSQFNLTKTASAFDNGDTKGGLEYYNKYYQSYTKALSFEVFGQYASMKKQDKDYILYKEWCDHFIMSTKKIQNYMRTNNIKFE